MRTTLDLDEKLLEEAQRATGTAGKTAVIEEGLRALVQQAARRRLAALAGGIPAGERNPKAPAAEVVILVDTSVWIDYFRGGSAGRPLGALLESADVALHPFVHGELALGHLGRRRAQTLRDLGSLPHVSVVPDDEVLAFVEMHRLVASGIGWVDAHLVASALHARVQLWTLDKVLARVGTRLRVSA